ncbi:MAG: T9SS type A sorting domain-containing protein [Ignavibacteriaceae bacterium]|nr:T9SS type A sorting domain-containing protein [Ignavibacteriaceae bacterium]
MTKKYFLFISLALTLFFFGSVNAQQVLDEVDVIYVDNGSDGNGNGTLGTFINDPKYKEFPQTQIDPTVTDVYGWWENSSTAYYWGGTSRRASRYGSGNNTGAFAHFYCTVPVTDSYIVYHNMYSGNATTDAYVIFKRFGELNWTDSMRYNMQYNITPATLSSWWPLGIIDLFAQDSALTVEVGLDSVGSNTLRADAVALLRSRASGPDIEFGARKFTRMVIDPVTGDTTLNDSFYSDRVAVQFPQTNFRDNNFSTRNLTLFNLGSQTLNITSFSTQTSRFTTVTAAPLSIPVGGKADLVIKFDPLGEEVTLDTLTVFSNDNAEPEAKIALIGEGLNYNFILNASLDGSEPHYNIANATFERIGTGWLASTPSPYVFPVPGGNIKSIVNTGDQTQAVGIYRFQLPDANFGNYYIEFGGPYTGNAATSSLVEITTPFVPDTMVVTGFNQNLDFGGPKWSRLGGNRVFALNSGGESVVKFSNPAAAGLIRLDLLRLRMVPIAPAISTNLDPARLLNFGSVSIYDSIRLAQFNYQKNIEVSSNGETPLVIDSMWLASGSVYHADNMPQFPLTLPAIDGTYNLLISYLPSDIRLERDTLFVRSNSANDSLIFVRLSGQGVGNGITVDDQDPTTYIFPEIVDWVGTPDPLNIDKWYRVSGSGINNTRLFTYIYFNPSNGLEKVEWFPNFPFLPGGSTVEPDSFDIYVTSPTGSSISTPTAKYIIKHVDGVDTIIYNQNSTANGGNVNSSGRLWLGRYTFLRGGQDSPGGGTIYGSVELQNDTSLVSLFYADSLVNTARRDSFVLRADALILEEAGVTGISTDPFVLPMAYELSQNYPNPFNPTTQIRFSLPIESNVEMKIYDILGREVATLIKGAFKPGSYTIEWNGRNTYGVQVASGMYIYRISAGKFVQTKKMMMLK